MQLQPHPPQRGQDTSPLLSPLPAPFVHSTDPIEKPHRHDVLCGRGGTSNNHHGNDVFRTVVNKNKPLYKSCPKHHKVVVAKAIVEAVKRQQPPGRFLARNDDDGMWYEIEYKKAVDKTSQALREKDKLSSSKEGSDEEAAEGLGRLELNPRRLLELNLRPDGTAAEEVIEDKKNRAGKEDVKKVNEETKVAKRSAIKRGKRKSQTMADIAGPQPATIVSSSSVLSSTRPASAPASIISEHGLFPHYGAMFAPKGPGLIKPTSAAGAATVAKEAAGNIQRKNTATRRRTWNHPQLPPTTNENLPLLLDKRPPSPASFQSSVTSSGGPSRRSSITPLGSQEAAADEGQSKKKKQKKHRIFTGRKPELINASGEGIPTTLAALGGPKRAERSRSTESRETAAGAPVSLWNRAMSFGSQEPAGVCSNPEQPMMQQIARAGTMVPGEPAPDWGATDPYPSLKHQQQPDALNLLPPKAPSNRHRAGIRMPFLPHQPTDEYFTPLRARGLPLEAPTTTTSCHISHDSPSTIDPPQAVSSPRQSAFVSSLPWVNPPVEHLASDVPVAPRLGSKTEFANRSGIAQEVKQHRLLGGPNPTVLEPAGAGPIPMEAFSSQYPPFDTPPFMRGAPSKLGTSITTTASPSTSTLFADMGGVKRPLRRAMSDPVGRSPHVAAATTGVPMSPIQKSATSLFQSVTHDTPLSGDPLEENNIELEPDMAFTTGYSPSWEEGVAEEVDVLLSGTVGEIEAPAFPGEGGPDEDSLSAVLAHALSSATEATEFAAALDEEVGHVEDIEDGSWWE